MILTMKYARSSDDIVGIWQHNLLNIPSKAQQRCRHCIFDCAVFMHQTIQLQCCQHRNTTHLALLAKARFTKWHPVVEGSGNLDHLVFTDIAQYTGHQHFTSIEMWQPRVRSTCNSTCTFCNYKFSCSQGCTRIGHLLNASPTALRKYQIPLRTLSSMYQTPV